MGGGYGKSGKSSIIFATESINLELLPTCLTRYHIAIIILKRCDLPLLFDQSTSSKVVADGNKISLSMFIFQSLV